MSNQSQTGDLLGRIFDRRYRVNELIGSGGMGSVYRATHLEMNREVALKVLERGVADTDKQVQRFYQEARASSRLQHPNTIRVFDFGRADDGRLYLAMEYLRGETLTELLRRQKRLSVDRSCHIIRQVCKSLAEAHQVGIIHRDLKPDNIFITDVYGERDFVKVLDFGIAKSTDTEGQESLTQTGFICGTPRYLSPEQAMGKTIDARSDLYSVGVMLYEMLSGHPPFAAATPIALVMKHIHEPPPKLPDGGRERAQWMSSLVFALMQKLPARRPPSSVIVAQALDDIAKGLQPAGVLQRGQSPAPRPTNRSRAASVIPNRRRSSTTVGNNQPATAALSADKAVQAFGERQLDRSANNAPLSTTGRDAIVVDDPHDAVTNRGVFAVSDPDEEPTHISVSAMVDPDEGPTNISVSAMFEQDVEVTQFGMSVMVDPDEEPEQFGLPSADDTEDGPTDNGVSALPGDIEFRVPADTESASSTLATQEDAMFRSSLVTGKRLEEEPVLPAVAASKDHIVPKAALQRPLASATPDPANATRVMQSPLEVSSEGLPIGSIDTGPKWPNYILAAIVLLAFVAGGIAWWKVSDRQNAPKATEETGQDTVTTPDDFAVPEQADALPLSPAPQKSTSKAKTGDAKVPHGAGTNAELGVEVDTSKSTVAKDVRLKEGAPEIKGATAGTKQGEESKPELLDKEQLQAGATALDASPRNLELIDGPSEAAPSPKAGDAKRVQPTTAMPKGAAGKQPTPVVATDQTAAAKGSSSESDSSTSNSDVAPKSKLEAKRKKRTRKKAKPVSSKGKPKTKPKKPNTKKPKRRKKPTKIEIF